MQLFKKTCVTLLASFLMACGDTEPQTSALVHTGDATAAVTQPKTTGSNVHNIKNMQKVMEDARGIEAMLQKSHEQRQEELNKY